MRTLAGLLVIALLLSVAPWGSAWPTPGANLSLTRIVPEPYETNDFIGYDEARAMLLDAAREMLATYRDEGREPPIGSGHVEPLTITAA